MAPAGEGAAGNASTERPATRGWAGAGAEARAPAELLESILDGSNSTTATGALDPPTTDLAEYVRGTVSDAVSTARDGALQ